MSLVRVPVCSMTAPPLCAHACLACSTLRCVQACNHHSIKTHIYCDMIGVPGTAKRPCALQRVSVPTWLRLLMFASLLSQSLRHQKLAVGFRMRNMQESRSPHRLEIGNKTLALLGHQRPYQSKSSKSERSPHHVGDSVVRHRSAPLPTESTV